MIGWTYVIWMLQATGLIPGYFYAHVITSSLGGDNWLSMADRHDETEMRINTITALPTMIGIFVKIRNFVFKIRIFLKSADSHLF